MKEKWRRRELWLIVVHIITLAVAARNMMMSY
jgi:hypothetical protein